MLNILTAKRLLFSVMFLSLTGCGYHLRGSSEGWSFAVSNVYVQSEGAEQLAAELKRKLEQNEITVAKRADESQAIVILRGEAYDNRVLSVDPATGKVLENEIGYRVDVSADRPDGALLLELQTITLYRDLTFDPNAVLGKAEEEQAMRQDMLQDAAQSVMFRLQSIEADKLVSD